MRHNQLVLMLASAIAFTSAYALAQGDPAIGKKVFRFCAGCHSLEPGAKRVGPSLAGLFGRKAGTVEGFRYSKALRNADVVWDAETLDAWLMNPQRFIPGNRMPFRGIRRQRIRANLIEFLKDATK